MNLTSKELLILAGLYETETYRVFKKVLLSDRQMELAQASPFLPDIETVREFKGRILELQEIEKQMKKCYQLNRKKEDGNTKR